MTIKEFRFTLYNHRQRGKKKQIFGSKKGKNNNQNCLVSSGIPISYCKKPESTDQMAELMVKNGWTSSSKR